MTSRLPSFTPHNLSAEQFYNWVSGLPDEDSENVILFVPRLVMDFIFPDVSLSELRGFIKSIYEHRPNPTWDQFMEEMKKP